MPGLRGKAPGEVGSRLAPTIFIGWETGPGGGGARRILLCRWRRCRGATAPADFVAGLQARRSSRGAPTYPLRRVALRSGRECNRVLPRPA
eukprot:1952044-Lingulodinium_polyedra.AAC.1